MNRSQLIREKAQKKALRTQRDSKRMLKQTWESLVRSYYLRQHREEAERVRGMIESNCVLQDGKDGLVNWYPKTIRTKFD